MRTLTKRLFHRSTVNDATGSGLGEIERRSRGRQAGDVVSHFGKCRQSIEHFSYRMSHSVSEFVAVRERGPVGGRYSCFHRYDKGMKMVPRRTLLGSAASILATGCLAEPTENTEPVPGSTVSPTPTGPVERGLEIRNEFETEQTLSLKVIEYQSGFPENGRHGEIQSVTATPMADERVVRYDSELTIDADGRKTVRDVFTLTDSPRKYYLSFESDEVAKQEYTFTIEKGLGFSYLSITLDAVPDIVITTQ